MNINNLSRKICAYLLTIGFVVTASIEASQELVPTNFVDSQLKGYSSKDVDLIKEDLANITRLCFRDATHPSQETQPIYIATAGGPGASKSTILEQYLESHPGFVYADPDQRALVFMINTYRQSLTNNEIRKSDSYKNLLKKAYEEWRSASNYIACTILNEAYAKAYNIAHGTTSTATQISGLYDRLKEKKYKIVLFLCASPDEIV